ncbi:MAG: glutamate synthase large subunit [Armatimonadota bacterium]
MSLNRGFRTHTASAPLYSPAHEHDSCGVGFAADVFGRRSHAILQTALTAVVNLTHRGAVSADAKTGDGAGILTQLPHKLFMRETARSSGSKPDPEHLAVAVLFLPNDPEVHSRCSEIVSTVLARHGIPVHAWRPVPVEPLALGDKALATRPEIYHVIVSRPAGVPDGDAYERQLYLARKEIERRASEAGISDLYIPSFSHRTIVYKGLVAAPQLSHFYPDLSDPDYETALAVFHQRYSTNTFPTWRLAQPFRMLAHNGEINTIQGNRNWTRAREAELRSEVWGDRITEVLPILQEEMSDSGSLDNLLELLVLSGRHILHAMMMLVPEAYQNMPHMDPDLHGFYEYHACLSEPWDGPAALAFTDGTVVGASLDRNGLRPARYALTDDGLVIVASEAGVIDLDPGRIAEKGRLGPGMMIAVDTVRGELLRNDDIKRRFSQARPYSAWVRRWLIRPESFDPKPADVASCDHEGLLRRQKAFGYHVEDIDRILEPMAEEGKEPVGSMGDDTPLAVLSTKPRLVYTYLKQRFAQVTNPPIDPIREKLVMSINSALGRRGSILEERPESARLIKLSSPVLTAGEMRWLRDQEYLPVRTLQALFAVGDGPAGLRKALDLLCEDACEAVRQGCEILVLSDIGIDAQRAPIPMLLAVGAVHHALIRAGLHMRASIVAETGEPREDHHFACLIGYGAGAVYPYLAYETVAHLHHADEAGAADATRHIVNYKHAVEYGLYKIMSKMGISTLSSYRGAQVFEAVGLSREVVDACFAGTDSRVGGAGFEEIARDVLAFHREAFGDGVTPLQDLGFYRYRHGGEDHAFKPSVFKALHKAVRSGRYEDYLEFAREVEGRAPLALRDLLEFVPGTPIDVDEVEPIESIVRRFCTPAMSHGALSAEAHETIAIAMNRLGAKSNSGEGGEDPRRYHRLPNGDSANSAIKQVASARFGVTPEYLASARELEIKMAQGSKPGEGGQLPGHKVTEEIARIRHSVPGVTLISPPPHHDIYSIEDLAQLIYDLKHANPRARIAVKLVSEAGIGTIAAGVAKAYADVIHISGHDGGTGASPLGSIKHAGVPWEIGLAEAQQVLIMNDLRGRVVLRADGGLKTGRDVVIAAMLGAEEFAFGTAALVAAGCVMARQCHSNTCPVGVASQRPDLRAKFPGKPEWVVNYMLFIARQVREILASLGFRSLDEVIGRTNLLRPKPGVELPKTQSIHLSAILAQPDDGGSRPRMHIVERNDRPDAPLDAIILQDAMDAIQGRGPVKLRYSVRNVHRAVGAMLAGEIAFRYGDQGLPPGTIECRFEGTAGQSFGAFCIRGMRLVLVGEANDYVGKGMSGGEIVIMPPPGSRFASHENVIVGNTVLYGATGGWLFAAGRAGERFCVRNSGARAVVEGVGDHACEYMTRGLVAVLGETGRNFGAGMTGGTAYVLDESGQFVRRYNPQLVGIERIVDPDDAAELRQVVERHKELTGSARAAEILDQWDRYLPLFWKVVPHPAAGPAAGHELSRAAEQNMAQARA